MIKKILLSFALFGFVFGSPILASASSFTSLKAQLFDLSEKIENFKLENKTEVNGEVLGASSGGSLRVDLWTKQKNYNIDPSSSVEVRWNIFEDSSKVKSCVGSTVNGNILAWNGSKAIVSGSQILTNITKSDTLQLTCVFEDNVTEMNQLTLLVKADTPTPTSIAEIPIFSSNVIDMPYVPYDITLTWESKNSTECQWIMAGGTQAAFYQWPRPNMKALKGSQTITNMLGRGNFSLQCKNEQNNSYARKDIDVKFKPVLDFKANPSTVPYLGSTTLTWDSNVNLPFDQKDNYCKAGGDWSGVKDVSGSFVVAGIKSDKTFRLDCYYNQGGYYSKTVTVKVIKPDDKTDYPGPNPDTNKDDDSQRVGTNGGTCSAFLFKKTLAYGSKDSKSSKDVALMQSVLVDEGLLPAKDATGVFYAKTQTALKNFQKKYNLPQTGKLDTKTADKMNTLFAQYCGN